jgi:hypothetical protein
LNCSIAWTPTAPGFEASTLTCTCGRDGRRPFHQSGSRTTSPLSSVGVLRGPGQGLKEPARFQKLAHKRALVGRRAHRSQERVERFLILAPGVCLQGAAQGHVLKLAGGRELIGVRGQEGERLLFVALIFREMKRHTPHQMPERTARSQPFLQAARTSRRFVVDTRPHVLPQTPEQGFA